MDYLTHMQRRRFLLEYPSMASPVGRGRPGAGGRILLLHQRSGFLLGLCQHPGRTGDLFDLRRTGLDHIAFEVADRAELTSWMAHLDALGAAHSPVRALGHASFVSLEDPDRCRSSYG